MEGRHADAGAGHVGRPLRQLRCHLHSVGSVNVSADRLGWVGRRPRCVWNFWGRRRTSQHWQQQPRWQGVAGVAALQPAMPLQPIKPCFAAHVRPAAANFQSRFHCTRHQVQLRPEAPAEVYAVVQVAPVWHGWQAPRAPSRAGRAPAKRSVEPAPLAGWSATRLQLRNCHRTGPPE